MKATSVPEPFCKCMGSTCTPTRAIKSVHMHPAFNGTSPASLLWSKLHNQRASRGCRCSPRGCFFPKTPAAQRHCLKPYQACHRIACAAKQAQLCQLNMLIWHCVSNMNLQTLASKPLRPPQTGETSSIHSQLNVVTFLSACLVLVWSLAAEAMLHVLILVASMTMLC